MTETKTNEKKEMPLNVAFFVILVCVAIAYFNQAIGAISLTAASIMAYYADRNIKYKPTSIVLVGIGILIYYLNVTTTPLFSTFCLMASMAAICCSITNIIFDKLKFFDGLMYSAIIGVVVMILLTVLFYFINDQQSQLSEVILVNAENFLLNIKTTFINDIISVLTSYAKALEGEITLSEFIQQYLLSEKEIVVESTMEYIEAFVLSNYAYYIIAYPMLSVGLTWWIGNKLKYRTVKMTKDAPVQKPKPFSTFRYPRWTVNVIMLLILASFFMQMSEGSANLMYMAVTLQNISLLLISVQGAAVMEFILKRQKAFKNAVWRTIFIMLIIIVFMGIIPLMLGMMDIIINIRFLYAHRQNRQV